MYSSLSFFYIFQTAPNVTDATFTTGVAIQTINDGNKSSIFEVSFNSERSGVGKLIANLRIKKRLEFRQYTLKADNLSH